MQFLIALIILIGFSTSASANEKKILNDFSIIDDKLGLDLNSYKEPEDFFFNIKGSINEDLMGTISDLEYLNDNPNQSQAEKFVDKYNNQIKNFKFHSDLGIKLFKHSETDFTMKTHLKFSLDAGGSALIFKQKLTTEQVINFLPPESPAELKNFIRGLNVGDDIIDKCLNDPDLSLESKLVCSQYSVNSYFVPNSGVEVPSFTYIYKRDIKAGFYNYFTNNKHLFGFINIYAMERESSYQLITADQLNSGAYEVDFFDDASNKETTLQLDYMFGYRDENHSAFISMEEMKIGMLKPRDENTKEHFYPYRPMFRFQTNSRYYWDNLVFEHFLGIHSRGYDAVSGIYLGINPTIALAPKHSLNFMVMADQFYLTLAPKLQISKFFLEFSYKTPTQKSINELDLTPIQSINLGLSF